jgi:hypothetical protein
VSLTLIIGLVLKRWKEKGKHSESWQKRKDWRWEKVLVEEREEDLGIICTRPDLLLFVDESGDPSLLEKANLQPFHIINSLHEFQDFVWVIYTYPPPPPITLHTLTIKPYEYPTPLIPTPTSKLPGNLGLC